jgi:threonylcarbamoyladenosine tRNA methylthiotransferase MtaB
MTFRIITLGCKVNFYESEALRERLLRKGYSESPDAADLFFVNTCAVTAEAEKKDLQKVRDIARDYPKAKIAVMGCSSQIHKEKFLAIKGVEAVIGNSHKTEIEDLLLRKEKDSVDADSRHFSFEESPIEEGAKTVRAYLKVQDGCDNFCSYCVVPFTRGNSRSRSHVAVIEEARCLLRNGFRELVIGGIDTGSYQDPEIPGYDLTHLLADMLSLSSEPYRIRVSSIEATQVREDYLSLFEKNPEKLCPHFHLPLQSGSEKILRAMNRKYSREEFLTLVGEIRRRIPHAALSTDVITGFPGESEEDFQETLDLCEKAQFMRIHAFPYSERPKTMASALKEKVPMPLRLARVRKLIALSQIQEKEYRKSLAGTPSLVLIEEKKKDGLYSGYSQYYLTEEVSSEKDILGTFVRFPLI